MQAGPGAVTNYADPSIDYPEGITAGPDGALWFANINNNSIGRITTGGTVTNYTDPSIEQPIDITAGPDGALWFTNDGRSIGRITTTGAVTNYTDPNISPQGITAGPDGALWFTNLYDNSIGRITTAGVITTYSGIGIDVPVGITTGSDGALWFTNFGNNSIGRITTTGTVTNYTDPSIDQSYSITAGPDGALWFANFRNNSIGRITTGGTVTNYTDPSIFFPDQITAGPDGALWFSNSAANNSAGTIGRITPSGTVTSYPDPSIDYPDGITTGPDGAVWFTNANNNSIGRIITYTGTTSTTTGALVSPSTAAAGSPVSYSSTVTPMTGPDSPTGTVIFTVGALTLCTATLSGDTGSCNASNAPIGIDRVTATYGGDSLFAPSSGATALTVYSGLLLRITTTSLPSGSVWSKAHNVVYSAPLAATGGNPPYKWSLAPGSNPFPPGLKLKKATGVISGKAMTAGTYSFTVRAVDTKTKKTKGHPSTQNTATAPLSITIAPGP